MPVLIDGNNLLHAARELEDPDVLLGRSMLCDKLGHWAERQNEQVHIVFDGPSPPAPLAEQIGHASIQVTYSGRGTNADAVVQDILDGHSAARRLVVVSTDREVRQAARRRRARPVRSAEFWAALLRDLARPTPQRIEPEEKEAGLTDEAARQWLAEFGLVRPDEARPDRMPDAEDPP